MQRYNSLNQFLKNKFGTKVYKVSLFGGFTCPNRDGSKGLGGCIYCNPLSNLPLISSGESIKEQVAEGIGYVKKRHHGASKFISYFQHYSNTYGDISKLKKIYETAIDHTDIVGLAVSTRPDCLERGTLNLLNELNKRTFIWLEFGLQSAHDKTLKLLNRGHTVKEFEDAVKKAHELGIMTCAHIILGILGETHEDMIATIKFLTDLKVGGVKIHNLHILKDTKLSQMYEKGEIKPLSLQKYASLVVDCLERLPKETIIHRFNSHSPRNLTIAPLWSVNKLLTLNAVHEELIKRNTWQGKLILGNDFKRLIH